MDNPITNIKENISDLTTAQRSVADYILKNPYEVAFFTVDQLALHVGTSTTTIMRLAFNLGYSGYSEFQKGLQEILRSQTAPHARLESNLKNIENDDLWWNTINHHINQVQQMTEQISREQLDKVTQNIISARQIFCTSVRSGLPVGQYLTHGLNRTLGNCKMIMADSSDWVDDVISMESTDLIIATSFPRYAKRIIDFVKTAKTQGVQIVAITDNYSAPIVDDADIILPCDSSSLAFHNSPIGAMVVADYLINATARRGFEKTKQRLNEVNKVLTNINYHHGKPHRSDEGI
ncbi:DNA-binding MurR/RpiR family transcriptional regulator [Geomicrobium halophilum]|uniref:DNA-binding MurR/RpiR family transcriptional regulator n=1 Tax=Geomicrobium halophilum TaxID=549000 RepID=A0A841PQB0_9BACL|nr:MurR/RpiR family transcriptional regulator [Geomicrobium halophilum]MBB6451037.1 DNA-binding MurR/RpiR family transcriptional regulator [Geomicrobium halophilum]